MTDKTHDVDDPRDLPYRFVWSPVTQEVLIISMGRVITFFENKEAFYRFLAEGNNLEMALQSEPVREARGILRDKQGG